MEDSPVLENVDIRAWAQQIREMKIREFEEAIATTKKYFSESGVSYVDVKWKARIRELETKLENLKNAK